MKFVPLTAALVAATLALPLAAQETASGGETGLSMGEPEVGTTYVRDTFGDWEMRCITAPEGQPEPCQLYQLVTDGQDNPVAEFNLFTVPEGNGDLAAGATIVTPLDTLLTGQLRMAVDSNPARVYPFSFCQQIGCYVRLGMSGNDVQAFRAGSEATISIVPLQAPDQSVPLTLSLSGFTAGFDALQAYNDEVLAQLQAAQAAQDAEGGAASE